MKCSLRFALFSGFGLSLTASPVGVALGCDGGNAGHAAVSVEGAGPTLKVERAGSEKALLKVQGMSCASCEKSISAQLRKVEGVRSVSFRKGKDSEGARVAEVSFAEGAQVPAAALAQAVEKAGYQVVPR